MKSFTVDIELVEPRGADDPHAMARAMCNCGWRGRKHFGDDAIMAAEDEATIHVHSNPDRTYEHLLRTDGPLTRVVRKLSEPTEPLSVPH